MNNIPKDIITSSEMRDVLLPAYYYTQEHFKLLKPEDRKTLLAIIQNLSNPSEGIPITREEIESLKDRVEKINNPTEQLKLKRQNKSSLRGRIAKVFANQLGRVSSEKLNQEMNQLGDAYKKNTFLSEHRFNVQQSGPFKGHVERLWKSVNAGERPMIAKGACESRIYTYEGGKAIYKDMTPKDLSLKRTIEVGIKKLLGISRPTEFLPGKAPESKGFAEKVAYDLDQHLKLDLVPETNFINKPIGPHLEGNTGSLQIFLDTKIYKEAAEVAPFTLTTDPEKTSYQKFVVFDYLIGNLDRHDENWMIRTEGNHLIEVKAIDNGNSFPERYPTKNDKNPSRNQYRWGEHPFSTSKFTKETVDFVNNIDETKLRAFFDAKKDEMKNHPHTNTFFSEAMIEKTIERLRVLKAFVNESTTPEQLSQIKTQEAINKVLAEGLDK